MRPIKLALLIILFSLSTILPIIAQDMGSDIEKAEKLYNEGNYSEAVVIFEKWAKAYKETPYNENLYLNILSLAGYSYYNNNQFKQAEPFLIEISEIFKQYSIEISPLNATTLHDLGYLYQSINNIEKAELFYIKSLNIRESLNDTVSQVYLYTIDKIGELYYNSGSYEKAEQYYLKSLEITKQTLGENHPNYAQSINNICLLYFNMGSYEKAEQYHLKSLEIMKQTLGENHSDYAISLSNVGQLYYNMGNYRNAEQNYLKSIEIFKKINGENHSDYADMLNKVGNLYSDMGNYENAEKYYLISLEIYKKTLGEKHPDYANCLNGIGSLYFKVSNYEKANQYYLESIEIFKQTLGENHPDYATCLNNFGVLYSEIGNYDKAEQYYLKSIEIKKQTFGEDHLIIASSLNNLGLFYIEMGNYLKAEKLLANSFEIVKKNLGENHPDYAQYLNSIGFLYYKMGNYDMAEQYYLKSIEIRNQTLGESHPDYAESLNNIGSLYSTMGKYEKAEQFYSKSTEIIKLALGENHPDYAACLKNLGELYQNMGNYEKAEQYYLKSFEIMKQAYGEKHHMSSICLNNIGVLYLDMGNYEKSEYYFLLSSEINKQILGENHPDYANSLNNIGLLYDKMGKYEKVEEYYLKSLEIKKQTLGESHPNNANSLNNIGLLYLQMRNYEKAEQYLLNSLEITKQSIGENHPDYAQSLNSIGQLYNDIGNYEKSEQYYIKSLEIRKQTLGENHPDCANSLNNIGLLYDEFGKYEKAELYLSEANNNLLAQLKSAYNYLSEPEQEKFYNSISQNFNNYNYFSFKRSLSNPTISTLPLNNVLAIKGASLQAFSQMQKTILESNDISLKTKFQQLITLKEEINRLHNLPIDKRYTNVDSLEIIVNSIEKELFRSSKEMQESSAAISTTWKDVQSKLSSDEAAIEFINFINNGNVTYAALINRQGIDYPIMITICTEKYLYKSLFLDDISDDRRYIRNTISKENLKDLYQLVWEPLLNSLTEIKTIYISPSGLLSTIPFHALSPDDKTCLMDKVDIRYLMTTRDAGNNNPSIENNQLSLTAALFGGIQYEIGPQQLAMLESSTEEFASRAILPRDGKRSINSFNYLEGTAKEVASIENTLKKSNWSTNLYKGEQATELQFKRLSGDNAPAVLHIATHGFYFPLPEKEQKGMMMQSIGKDDNYRLTDNPLRRTGLAMAGANAAWRGDELPSGIEDGILTAYEIANMDLRKTQMVVLSACQTGLGDIKAGEGVFGLQRAFRMAGVKTIIMSLWNVDDTSTAEMMEAFFNNLSKNETRIVAFDNAVRTIRSKYPDNPEKWAAFVMVE